MLKQMKQIFKNKWTFLPENSIKRKMCSKNSKSPLHIFLISTNNYKSFQNSNANDRVFSVFTKWQHKKRTLTFKNILSKCDQIFVDFLTFTNKTFKRKLLFSCVRS